MLRLCRLSCRSGRCSLPFEPLFPGDALHCWGLRVSSNPEKRQAECSTIDIHYIACSVGLASSPISFSETMQPSYSEQHKQQSLSSTSILLTLPACCPTRLHSPWFFSDPSTLPCFLGPISRQVYEGMWMNGMRHGTVRSEKMPGTYTYVRSCCDVQIHSNLGL